MRKKKRYVYTQRAESECGKGTEKTMSKGVCKEENRLKDGVRDRRMVW